jgi:aspartyl/glutamyl-tRNA(Asn/Gln) amidotransferase C subunit
MSTLTHKDVQKVAKLARLSNKLPADELVKYTRELEAILEYTSILNEVDTSGVSSNSGRTITIDELREDIPSNQSEQYQVTRTKIIKLFPNCANNLLVLPGIFE